MTSKTDYLIKEYEISKDSIKSVMTQLIAVCASLLTVSIVILQLIFDDKSTTAEIEPMLFYLVLLFVNFIIVFAAYQNIQIQALQMHICSLEKRLPGQNVFRWESKIARVWYGRDKISIAINSLVVIPPFSIMVLIYFKLYALVGFGLKFLLPLIFNGLYISILAWCLILIITKLKKIIE